MKVVINTCFGGFSVSKDVYDELGMEWDGYGADFDEASKRSDPRLIAAIEKIGLEESSGCYAALEIVEIPDDVKFEIDDYDGKESIHECHRSWS